MVDNQQTVSFISLYYAGPDSTITERLSFFQ